MEYFIKEGYKPYCCNTFCPYASSCSHGKNIINYLKKSHRWIRKLPETIEYTDLDAVRQEIADDIRYAAKHVNAFTVLKTQTGTGKTHAALNFIKNSDRRVIIAFPTLNLMRETYEKLLQWV